MPFLKRIFDKVEYRGPGAILLFAIICAWGAISSQSYITYKRYTAMQVEMVGQSAVVKRGPDNMYFAKGKVNGVDVTFLLDTGATDVTISESLAKKIGLKRGEQIDYLSAAGPLVGYNLKVDTVEIGSIKLRNVRAGTAPMEMSEDIVLLGMSVLGGLEMHKNKDTMVLTTIK